MHWRFCLECASVNSIDLIKLPQILRSRRWLVAVCTVGLAAIISLGYVILPEKYTATASMVIDSRGIDHILGGAAAAVAANTLIATQSNIVRSDRVVKRVVSDLKMTKDPLLRAQWQAKTNGTVDASSWIAARLYRSLIVARGAPDSNVLDISFTDPDPTRAADLANAFAKAYLAVTQDLSSSPSRLSAKFFEDQVRSTRTALETAQAKLSAYQRENGITNNDEKLDIETAQLSELATALTVSRTRRIESLSRTEHAAGNAYTSPDVIQSPVVQALRTEVARADAKLKELSNSLGSDHPQYRAGKEQLLELQNKLAEEAKRVADSVNVGAQVNTQGEAQIRAALDTQRKRVLELKNRRDQLAVLERDADGAQKAYDQTMLRLSQTTQQSESGLVDVTLLTPASVPFEPNRPSPMLTVPFAAIVGLMIGVLFTLVLEHRSPRIRTARDIVETLRLPMLASLPQAVTSRANRQVTSRASRRELKASVP
jgi:succinoglycan biosynthesis transport protein ExoP